MKKLVLGLMAAAAISGAFTANASTFQQLYLMGDPNGWDINDSTYKLEPVGDTDVYSGTFNIEADNSIFFRFYTKTGDWAADGQLPSIGSGPNDGTSISLDFNQNDGKLATSTCTAGKGSWIIPSWTGGDITFTVTLTNPSAGIGTIEVSTGTEVTEPEAPENLYLVGALANASWEPGNTTYVIPGNGEGVYEGTITGMQPASGNTLEFKLTGGSWGYYEISAHNETAFELYNNIEYSFNYSGNSKNFSIANWDSSYQLYIKVDTNTYMVTLSCANAATTLEKVYLIGISEDWTETSQTYPLILTEDATFEGTLTMPANAFSEGFKIVAGGSWASSWGGDTNAVTLVKGQNVEQPLYFNADNFYVNNWTVADDITFTADLKNGTLGMEWVDPTAIDSLESAVEGPEVIYNLQGVKVNRENAAPGIYIVNGKKTVIR